jgi:hypothetical protein
MLKTTLLLVITAAIFALIGSQAVRIQAGAKHGGPPQQCKPDCSIKVKVEQRPSECLFRCDVYVDFDVAVVNKHNSITWEIADNQYEFDQKNGIVFEQSSGFTCPNMDKKKITCTSGDQSDVYKYSVQVKDKDPLDPWVVNN